MSGVEGVECEDYDDGEAGVGRAAGLRWIARALTTKGTLRLRSVQAPVHEANLAVVQSG